MEKVSWMPYAPVGAKKGIIKKCMIKLITLIVASIKFNS
jgi:hypothetical protein